MKRVLLIFICLVVLWGWGFPSTTIHAAASPQQKAVTVYHGNSKSYIFHGSGCRYFYCKNCTRVFKSRSAAISAGFRPCKICKP